MHPFSPLRSRLLPAWLLPGLLLLGGCSEGPPPAPVAKVEVELAEPTLPYPEWRSLRLRWRPSAPLGFDGQPVVFLHLLDGKNELVRTFDHPFPAPWVVGEEVQYETQLYQSALGPPLPAGGYQLVLGLYAADRGRWTLDIDGATPRSRREYSVARITVPAVDTDGPAFEFPPSWLPAEAGADRQILGRRWLTEDGSLRILSLEVPGTVMLRVTVPPGSGPEGWQLRRDSEPPSLEISSSCSGVIRTYEVPGTFEARLPVYPAGDELACELGFRAEYELVQTSSPERRILLLENLAWTAAKL